MNEYISQYLFQYMKNPNPQYAVMLKGKWGCGKSYFIQNWIKIYNERVQAQDKVLDPIYVSLYGLNNTAQITTAIDKVLHPYLYSKGASVVKKMLKIAGKVAFHSDFDLNGDNNNDFSIDATLDSLSLLSLKGEEGISSSKLLVFDDLERCLIDMKLLLGYINNFVEHQECHVIIVGDETHIKEEGKKQLDEFKEKTIGREFEVQPNEESAIDSFIQSLNGWLMNQKLFILDCFRATKCDNLRLLRQCLYDFSTLYDEINVSFLENGESFMKILLGSYILTYCEYRGEYREILKNWDVTYYFDEDTKKQVNSLQNKYLSIERKYQIDIFNIDNIQQIILGIEIGQSLKNYVEKILEQKQAEKSTLEKLVNFISLSNEEFDEAYNELENDIKNDNVANLYLIGRSLALLLYFDLNKIHILADDVIILAKQYIKEYFVSIKDKDNLYFEKTLFYQGLNSYGRFRDCELGINIMDFVDGLFKERDKTLKNRMEEVLFNLNDDNVKNLIVLSKDIMPDNRCSYNMTSVFKNVDADIFLENILKLSNSSLQVLCQFFSIHYEFCCNLASGCNYYAEDKPTLMFVREKLIEALSIRESVSKYALSNLLKYIEGAIKRAEGCSQPIEI